MDDEPRTDPLQDLPEGDEGVSRRSFLSEAAGAAGVATVAWFWLEGFGEPGRRADVELTEPGGPLKSLTPQEYRTLEAACDRLLPTGPDSPGARTVNAIGYLDAVLGQSFQKPDTASVIRGGAAKLDERARKMGARDFAALTPGKQDAAIRVFETFRKPDGSYPGHTWLKKMLAIILECFFGDPVHGGNPNEVAWKWAGHRPGQPRPETKNWRPVERGS